MVSYPFNVGTHTQKCVKTSVMMSNAHPGWVMMAHVHIWYASLHSVYHSMIHIPSLYCCTMVWLATRLPLLSNSTNPCNQEVLNYYTWTTTSTSSITKLFLASPYKEMSVVRFTTQNLPQKPTTSTAWPTRQQKGMWVHSSVHPVVYKGLSIII